MWYRNTVYFISDRGAEQRNNIWAEDIGTGAARQVTQYTDFDITFPSIGPDAIVFQKGGRLYLLSLPGEAERDGPAATPPTLRSAKAFALLPLIPIWRLFGGLWHNQRTMFRGLALTLVLTSVGISLPTRTG